jgi:transposase
MRDKDLYAAILGVSSPWRVREVELRTETGEVEVFIEHDGSLPLACPRCGEPGTAHDTRRRSWRHLDTCQLKTLLTADVPRVRCEEHGVLQAAVPWAEVGSRFTAIFECLAIDWLHEASITAVARRLGCTWDELDGIQQRAVERGLARRTEEPVEAIGVDETSFQKRHEYVTVVVDLKSPRVLYVADGRGYDALDGFYWDTPVEHLDGLSAVAMDMWEPYIRATLDHVPGAARKIAFDRFHVAKHLNDAVNDVRTEEHKDLLARDDDRLKRTRFWWLMGPEKREQLGHERARTFEELRTSGLKVARAWALKETARGLWQYCTRGWARRAWKRWLAWASRSRLGPMMKVARTIRSHLWGILNAVALRATNAITESVNAKIQWLKKQACGFRSRERFRTAIYFHCGGLDLYPRPAHVHTNS